MTRHFTYHQSLWNSNNHRSVELNVRNGSTFCSNSKLKSSLISSLKIFYLRPTRPTLIPTLKSASVTLMVTLTIWARIGEQESGKNCKLRSRSGTKKKRNSNPALIWCLLVLDCILVCMQVCNTKLARFDAGPGHINISQARPFFSSRNHVEKN